MTLQGKVFGVCFRNDGIVNSPDLKACTVSAHKITNTDAIITLIRRMASLETQG